MYKEIILQQNWGIEEASKPNNGRKSAYGTVWYII